MGGDGSSHHSAFNQKITEENSDTNVFASSCTLLAIHSDVLGEIFLNPSPNSVRFNFPWWIKFAKENVDLIKEHYETVINEINNIQPFELRLSENHNIIIEHDFTLGAYDGKIESVFCGTSSQSCINCLATPTEMGNIENIGNFLIRPFTKNFGFCILHAEIQNFNFFYNVAAKSIVKNGRGGQIRGSSNTQGNN